MRSVLVVIADVIGHEPLQMTFVEDDHVVKQIPAAVANKSLGHAVLPRTLETRSLRCDAKALDRLDHIEVEVGSAVAQKRRPSFGWFRIPRRLSHPAQHRLLGDVIAEHLQFAMDARRTPRRVLGDHAKDEFAKFFGDWLPVGATVFPRDPSPVQFESGAMPANNRFRLHDDQRFSPAGPQFPQYDPELSIMSTEPPPRIFRYQNGELLPQSQVFQQKSAPSSRRSIEQAQQKPQRTGHAPVITGRYMGMFQEVGMENSRFRS